MGSWRALLLVTFCWNLASATQCPFGCKCYAQSVYRVDCKNAGLTAVPELPVETETVDLSGNSIKVLRNQSFTPVLKSINLSNNGLVKIEVNAFANLRELKTLDLSHNNLNYDDFRDQEMFRGCREVEELDLRFNSLTRIPGAGFQLLTRLVKLHLSNNVLTDPTFGTEFVPHEDLQYVDLSGNNFAEIHKHSFQVLKSVQTLNLSSCGIHRIDADVLQYINNIVNFDISYNQDINQRDLNATIQKVCRSARISTIRLAGVNISDLSYVLRSLVHAEYLEFIDLSHNNLSELKSEDLSPVKALKRLDLSHNKMQSLPVLRLPKMVTLDASHNLISSVQEQNFEGSESVEKINLSHNLLTTFTSEPFSRNFKLETVDVSHNRIRQVESIDYLENLRELDVSNNLIEVPDEFFRIYLIEKLLLGNNKIRSLGSKVIPSSSILTHLNLTGNRISYIAEDAFSDWNPRVLDLSNNKLSGVDSWGLTVVRELYLQQNSITYIHKESMKNMNRLQILDLSTNRLEQLPETLFTNLIDLTELNLDNNDLGDYLRNPSKPGVFSSPSPIRLERLYLSSNNLRILRPNYLANLTVLKHLDLSHNKLTDVNSRQFEELSILNSLNIGHNELTGFNYTTVNPLVSLKSLDLSGTKWQCDCTMEDTLEWLKTTKIHIVGYDEYRCTAPSAQSDTLLQEFDLEGANCSSETVMEKTIILIIIGCTSFVILVVAAIVFWQHRWRLKKKLKKQHYRAMYERAQMPLPNNNGTPTTQTEYQHHHHPHTHHHSHIHTPQKTLPSCVEHGHPGQAFV